MHVFSFKVHLTNIRGLHANLDAVHFHLETDKPHLLFLTETAHTAKEKAGLFASLFAHNSRLDTSSATPPTLPHCDSSMPEVRIRNKEVLRVLCRLDVNKASGPDGLPVIVLKACVASHLGLV